MATGSPPRATVEDLYRTPEKAELIGGTVVPLMPAGRKPNRIAGRIFRSLDDHAQATGEGEAYTDNMGFVVPELSSGRESFSPDASYSHGPFPDDEMSFIEGPPRFAVEVRSKNNYGPAAERDIAAKRADYFEAGTLVVWDVDPEAELVRVYRRDNPDHPTVYTRGQTAEAEPAVPGWRLALDALFA